MVLPFYHLLFLRCKRCLKGFALKTAALLHFMMQKIQHLSLPSCPKWSQKKLLWAVPCDSVNDDLGIQIFQTSDHQIQILLSFIDPESSCKIIICKICPFQNMKKLKFDSLNILLVQILHSFQNPVIRFSWKTENCMDDHLNTSTAKLLYRLIKALQRISSSNISGSIFVNCLKSQLYPHWFLTVQFLQKIQDFIPQAVRPCSNG